MYHKLGKGDNQARGIAEYAIDFVEGRYPAADPEVLERVEWFHADSIGCAVSALRHRMNAPIVLREEAFSYPDPGSGAFCFGSDLEVKPEKAVLANSNAARELDSNGTNFGYNPRTGYQRGEFGHNDFYPVAVAGAARGKRDGTATLNAMLCLDEIRGRLAEVFGLKDHKIDHVVHGGIASAAVYGALTSASAEQIESAIGQLVAHYIPFRAIRAGHQLSDSKGASAAITAEMAVTCVERARRGFVGPADVFRNHQAIFCLFEPPAEAEQSPFDLELAASGSDFAIMGMHFKLGLYEHQSAGAIQAMLDLLSAHPELLQDPDAIERIGITIYEPAFGIIGDPAKRDPRTRQSADHSMVYIIATLLRKALQTKQVGWRELILVPEDYDDTALFDPLTRSLMERIDFQHGGDEYDQRYPDGIPTSVTIHGRSQAPVSSGLVMYPQGHARADGTQLYELVRNKFRVLTEGAVPDTEALWDRFTSTASLTAEQVRDWYRFTMGA